MMTKLEIARILVDSPAWQGEKDAEWLVKIYSKVELQDMFDMLDEAEEDYYNYYYNYR